jgi:RES domain-containing protein
MIVYRLTLEKYGNELSASGVEGRWNYKSEYVIYTAASRSMSLLENLVHRGFFRISSQFIMFSLQIPDKLKIKTLPGELFKGGNSLEINKSRRIGSDWLRSQEDAVLEVPCSIIPEESNYVLNVMHPDFKKIKLLDVTPFRIDQRLKVRS